MEYKSRNMFPQSFHLTDITHVRTASLVFKTESMWSITQSGKSLSMSISSILLSLTFLVFSGGIVVSSSKLNILIPRNHEKEL